MAFAVASGVVLLLIPAVKHLCTRFDLLDRPGSLKIHSKPIPRIGGVAIGLAMLSAAVLARNIPGRNSMAFVGAFALIWLAGLTDDLRELSPAIRLTAQIIAATLLWRSGLRVDLVENTALNFIVTTLFVLFFVNAFNFLDGIDGLAAGTAAILAIACGTICASGMSPAGLVLAWSLAGACVAFLTFNFPPASIFMGDSGSTVLGFSIAVMSLDYYRTADTRPSSLVFPILIAAVPLLDAGLAVLRRLRRHISVVTGDRRHLYDLVAARGYSPRDVVLTFYALTTGLVGAGWISLRIASSAAILLATACWVVLGFWAIHLGALRSGNDANPVRARAAFEL